jgi:hypothetical protein
MIKKLLLTGHYLYEFAWLRISQNHAKYLSFQTILVLKLDGSGVQREF